MPCEQISGVAELRSPTVFDAQRLAMPGIIPVRERGPDGRPVLEVSLEPSVGHSGGDGQTAGDVDGERLLLMQERVAIVLGDASIATSQEEPGTVYVTNRLVKLFINVVYAAPGPFPFNVNLTFRTPESPPHTPFVRPPRRLIWLSSLDPSRGLAVPLVSLAMHAICRDTQAYPRPCIYAQVREEGRGREERQE